MENKEELRIQNIIKNFNNDFHTKIKSDNAKFLLNMYNNFIIFESSDANDKNNLNKLCDLEEMIFSTFNKQEKALFDEWNKVQEKMFNEMEQQAFVYGYCICQQLEKQL